MNASEKADLLKDTIEILYTEEGRSFSYIERLLKINRGTISKKIKEWGFAQNKSITHLTPSNQKWVNSNKEAILSALNNDDWTVKDIAKELNVGYDKLLYIISRDKQLSEANQKRRLRAEAKATERREMVIEKRREPDNLEGEMWKPILGYSGYEVSNLGRVKSHKQGRWKLLSPSPNVDTGRLYISMAANNGKKRNIMLARVVGFAFCDGHSEERNTINHIDGDFLNNRADNLEWVSQAENNLHAYRELNRAVVNGRRYEFKEIVFKDKYRFKTVAAFARFLGKSETQTRRYLDEPEKHDIKLIL